MSRSSSGSSSLNSQRVFLSSREASPQKMISVAGLSEQVLNKLCEECRPVMPPFTPLLDRGGELCLTACPIHTLAGRGEVIKIYIYIHISYAPIGM